MAFKKGVNPKTGESLESKETPVFPVVPVVEPRNMQVMDKETKQVKCIRKSEYNYLIHTAI